MPTPERRTPDAQLPAELRGLTYDRATPEQIAEVREFYRAKLATAGDREERARKWAAFLAKADIPRNR